MRDNDNVKVEVVSETEGELVIRTPDGKEKTYYLNPIRTMRLIVEELQVNCGASSLTFGMPERLPPPQFSIRGQAWLEGGKISVIGEPSNQSRTFSIAFKPYDEAAAADMASDEERLERRPDLVTLGFVRRDWEIGNDDEWFTECYVSPRMIDAIVSAVSAGTLKQMNLNLRMEKIYSDNNWAPPSAGADWFLRPSRPDNSLKFPELSHGAITGLNLALSKVDLRSQPEEEPNEELEDDEKPEPPPDMRLLALTSLNHNIEKFQGTVKTVGWAIVLLLLMLVLKQH